MEIGTPDIVNENKVPEQCLHCNEETLFPIYSEDKVFCCNGCQTVHFALEEGGLLEYYKVRERLGISDNLTARNTSKEDFSYMNEPQFTEEFIIIGEDSNYIKFYVEGIHCLACIWLLEKLPAINSELHSSRINFSNSILDLRIKKGCDLESVANQIADLGYRPHVIKDNSEAQKLQQSEEHTKLIRIGVAGACSANIMLYSIAIYAGAGEDFASLFGWVTFILTLPVLLYSAVPFYESSLSAIRTRTLNIDIPISSALILGSMIGLYNLIIGSSHYYFDTLAILVFLLLTSRYLVQKSIQKGLNSDGLASLFQQSAIKRWNETIKEYELVHTKFIEVGDTLLVDSKKTIPSDGLSLSEHSYLNNSLITGESRPAKVLRDEKLYAGAVNLGEPIKMRVEKLFEESTLGKIIAEVETGQESKNRIQSITDKISRRFIIIIFSISIISFFLFLNTLGIDTAIERTLAIIIISCPCALGLAAPLAIARAMAKARENGIIIKNDSCLEDIARIENIFFDKTGTLTDGNFSVVEIENEHEALKYKEILYALEENSNHPIARAIQNWTRLESAPILESIQEIPSKGVTGKKNGVTYSLFKSSNIIDARTAVDFIIDEDIISTFHLSDNLKENAYSLISFLHNTEHQTHIISGDNNQTVNQVAKELSIKTEHTHSNQTPESKAALIANYKQSIMVGDGANDAIAMKKATVSIAVSGAMDIGLRASDIYLTKSPLKSMIFLMKLAKLTNTSIKVNLVISFIYNVIGVTLSLLGYISPLTAAILMPFSSTSVLIATLVNMKGIKRT